MNKSRRPATDNSWPLRDLFKQGELGISERENRQHWHDACRFKRLLKVSRSEPTNDSLADNWREIVPEYIDRHPDSLIEPLTEPDQDPSLNDDMDWEEALSETQGYIDNSGWNPFRDLHAPAELIEAKQVIALAANVLGSDFNIVCSAIDKNWTLRMLGETEGYTDRVSAAACGKGMLRAALRKLSQFYLGLDRLELELVPATSLWPLVGTHAWLFAEQPDARWKREPIPKICSSAYVYGQQVTA